jgi:hypothetical protein
MERVANGVVRNSDASSDSDSDSDTEPTDEETANKVETGRLFRCKHCRILYACQEKLNMHVIDCED